MEFKVASLDRVASITTILVTVLLSALSAFFIITVPFGSLFAILMLSIILFSYLLSPTKYVFDGSRLVIWKVCGRKIVIPLQDVKAYVIIPDFAKLRVSRTFGNGGLFGYYGMFSTAEYGMIICQLTRLKDVLIIQSKHGTYALSPKDMARFEEHLVNAVKGLRGGVSKLLPSLPTKMKLANPLLMTISVLIFVLTVIMVITLYTRLPERIAVHFDMQGNPDGWSSRTSFITAGIVPAIVLCALSIAIFLFVRKTTQRPAIPYMMLLLFAFFQLFVAYVSFEIYWFNENGAHLIAFPYNMIIFVLIVLLLLFAYFRKTRKTV